MKNSKYNIQLCKDNMNLENLVQATFCQIGDGIYYSYTQ